MDQSKRQARLARQQSERRRSQARWLVYIVIAAVIITGLLIFGNQVRAPEPRTYTNKAGLSLGESSASVLLIEVADFQCPVCGRYYREVEDQIIEEYVNTGVVLYTYQPVGFLDAVPNGESSQSAEAAYCAADQNLFWEYHDVLFANQAGENAGAFADDRLIAFAETAGLDMTTFESCFLNDVHAATVSSAEAGAAQLGITSIPTFIINGEVFVGFRTFEQLQQIIEQKAAEAGG